MSRIKIKITRFLPVQSYCGHTALRGEVSRIFRLHKVFGIEEVVRRCGSGIAPQCSDAIKKTWGFELPDARTVRHWAHLGVI